jgi:hypothetical protein
MTRSISEAFLAILNESTGIKPSEKIKLGYECVTSDEPKAVADKHAHISSLNHSNMDRPFEAVLVTSEQCDAPVPKRKVTAKTDSAFKTVALHQERVPLVLSDLPDEEAEGVFEDLEVDFWSKGETFVKRELVLLSTANP